MSVKQKARKFRKNFVKAIMDNPIGDRLSRMPLEPTGIVLKDGVIS